MVFWNHADISIGSFDATAIEKPKQIRTRGLTFGADKKYGENKYFGTAIRYGNSDSDIKFSAQGINLKSLTLNMYGTIPIDQYRYSNAILGLSILRFDQRFLGKITGERNGKQAFTALNFRTKNTYGAFNFTPSARFNYGITNLSNLQILFLKQNQEQILFIKKKLLKMEKLQVAFYLISMK